jgi:hypothetical protein
MYLRPYEQEDLYTSIYEETGFAGNKWINWEEINHFKELKDVKKKIMSKRQD